VITRSDLQLRRSLQYCRHCVAIVTDFTDQHSFSYMA